MKKIDSISNRIKYALEYRGMKQAELAKLVGIDRSQISNYISGKYNPKQDGIFAMSQVLNVSPAWLMGFDVSMFAKTESEFLSDFVPNKKEKSYVRIPVFSSIPAGVPLEMIDTIVDYEDIDAEMCKGGKEFFALVVKGNSMFPKYIEGDVIIVQYTSECESGTDCVVSIGNQNATLKRVLKSSDSIMLEPFNRDGYEPQIFSMKEARLISLRIIGVVKELRRKI